MTAGNKKAALAAVSILLALAALCACVCGCGVSLKMKKSMYPLKLADEICTAADANGLDRALVAAVVNTESGFDANAVSSAGAKGLMQVMPTTAEWIDYRRGTVLEEDGLFDPETNLDYGCWLLKYLIDRFDGNERYALIAYNAGLGRTEEWLKNEEYLDENGELEVIPYAETRNYVDKVLNLKEIYGELYAEELGIGQ